MLLCTDVQYYDEKDIASVAGGLFQKWTDDDFLRTIKLPCYNIQPYEPGEFYKRELPCLIKLIKQIEEPLEAIIVDGYVCLGKDMHPGLGQYLWDSLEQKVPIIGIAKAEYRGTPYSCEILRPNSIKPLYVTVTSDISLAIAKKHVLSMSGGFRIPTLLKKVDQIARTP